MNKLVLGAIIAVSFIVGTITTGTLASAVKPMDDDPGPFEIIIGLLTNSTFGLEEIKDEVRFIEGNVTIINATVNAIKTDVGDIDDLVLDIEDAVTDPVFGLEEIKNEVRFIEGNVTLIKTDLETKLKLSSDKGGPSKTAQGDDRTSLIQIRALDDGQPTTFNLKECYLEGTAGGSPNQDDRVLVKEIFIDGVELYQGPNGSFASFGPIDGFDLIALTAMVEVISGLGFTTGLGADDAIVMRVILNEGERIDEIFCIGFVQNSADLQVLLFDSFD